MRSSLTDILIVAPRFPSINQPWIDTYLEQLLIHGFEPAIFSSMRCPGVYDEKVDRLGLRARVLPWSFQKKTMAASVLRKALTPKSLARAWRIARRVTPDNSGLAASTLKSLYFISRLTPAFLCKLVHSHAEHLAYDFLHLAMLHDVPLVLTFHGLPPTGIGQLISPKRNILYKYVARVVVNTEFAREQVCSVGCEPKKVEILPQGLPIADFPFKNRNAPVLGEPVSLLTVGRYHRDKGQGYALLALRRLLDRGILASWIFVGVGPDRKRLERMVQRLGLVEHVSFQEGLSSERLKNLYQTSHILILPSISSPGGHVETQGVVLQEAQASGCIPIASRVGGIPECVNHQKDALLVKEKSSRSIADAVQYLLERPEEWAAYQEAGRRNVEENYSADVIGQKMADLLRDVVKNWKGYEGMPMVQGGERA